MKLFRFDAEVGRSIDQFGSSNLVMSRIVRTTGYVQVGCMHIGSGGAVGRHQTAGPQLFLVVQGQGWVRGAGPDRVAIGVGQAAFWEQGEWHEADTDSGMVAIVIEGDTLDPTPFMPNS